LPEGDDVSQEIARPLGTEPGGLLPAIRYEMVFYADYPRRIAGGDGALCVVQCATHLGELSACLLLSAVLLWVALVGLFWKLFRLEKQGTRVGGRLQTAFGRDKFGARTAQGTGTMLYAEITKLTILRGFVFVECRNAKRSVTRVKETCHWSE
jgi:hypothetical protein